MFAARNSILTRPTAPPPSVTYDATGAGANSGGGTVTSLSWSHTATAGAYAVVAFARTSGGGGLTGVTYGGSAMTLLASVSLGGNVIYGDVFIYGRAAVAGGAQTVATTWSGGAYASGCSVSYLNVGSTSSAATTFATDAAPTQTISGASRAMLFNIQSYFGGGTVTRSSSSGGTQRHAALPSIGYEGIVIQDSASTGSVNFASVLSGSTQWGSAAARLNAA